jgi:predicted PurR-regulated permease PerM
MRFDSLPTVRPQVFERIASLLWVIVLALTIAFCFFASSFCITLVLATFLSILVDPTVTFLERWCLPRSVSSALLISAGVLALLWRATVPTIEFPPLLRPFLLTPIEHKIAKVEESAGRINPENAKKITG